MNLAGTVPDVTNFNSLLSKKHGHHPVKYRMTPVTERVMSLAQSTIPLAQTG